VGLQAGQPYAPNAPLRMRTASRLRRNAPLRRPKKGDRRLGPGHLPDRPAGRSPVRTGHGAALRRALPPTRGSAQWIGNTLDLHVAAALARSPISAVADATSELRRYERRCSCGSMRWRRDLSQTTAARAASGCQTGRASVENLEATAFPQAHERAAVRSNFTRRTPCRGIEGRPMVVAPNSGRDGLTGFKWNMC